MKTFISALLSTAAMCQEVVVADNGYAAIQITENGKAKTLYVGDTHYGSHDKVIDIPYNSRAMLMETNYMDPVKIYRPNLLGGSVDYDVDLSQSNCGCIAAFYLVSAPGKNSSG